MHMSHCGKSKKYLMTRFHWSPFPLATREIYVPTHECYHIEYAKTKLRVTAYKTFFHPRIILYSGEDVYLKYESISLRPIIKGGITEYKFSFITSSRH